MDRARLAPACGRGPGDRTGDPEHGRAAAPNRRRDAPSCGWWSRSATARSTAGFAGGYGVEGAVSDVVPVDPAVPGCPPKPEKIVAALQRVTGR
ncbi:hypothetical protein RB628_25230 [Streptomyces sp. ADMS]|uniref:NADH-quinone oxidoreductase subunit B family protein n=1 Tax=Streptomyces sp. ADMS TaxID=3071415 RepID=UPI00296FC905|nr:hypothetical protein [Streptomyces sp. ADMS]MDW4908551.1 hypothetical protein [Streptomyces sp. ADMS]